MLLPWRDLAPGDGPLISTSITEREAARLGDLADEAADVLEIGSAYGFSAVTMALTGATVTAVDPHTWLASAGQMVENLIAYGVVGRVEVIQLMSFVALPELEAAGRRFGLIFIDGDHAEPAVAHDADWARKLLAGGGVLACHDWDEDTCPGVRMALERVLGQPDELVDTLAIYKALA